MLRAPWERRRAQHALLIQEKPVWLAIIRAGILHDHQPICVYGVVSSKIVRKIKKFKNDTRELIIYNSGLFDTQLKKHALPVELFPEAITYVALGHLHLAQKVGANDHLEALLAHSNQHLEDFAKRYSLQRVPGNDLELQIIDWYMADDVRSIHSLARS